MALARRFAASNRLLAARFLSSAKCETEGVYPGNNTLKFTSELDVYDPAKLPRRPVFRMMDTNGKLRPGVKAPGLDQQTAVKMYRTMGLLQAFDDVFYNVQRQGRISFYMQNAGEEAVQVGSAAALTLDDVIFAQYREAGVVLWRGFPVQRMADQCFSNKDDLGKGRQMPVHYGTLEYNIHTISSPLATQIPQASGAAYALKMAKKKAIAMCYFGEGAASEGDFHAALNFASTTDSPVVFFCRNNGFAISTPVKDQYRGDGIISRAAGYGMHSIRVDGNDVFAVYEATKEAKRICLEQGRPVLIEAMTYRRGHHSTSDDSTRYRSVEEIKHWQEKDDPMTRFRLYLESQGWWNAELEQQLREEARAEVLQALEVADNKEKPPVTELFTDVYDSKPAHLQRQEAELHEHLAKYGEVYANKH